MSNCVMETHAPDTGDVRHEKYDAKRKIFKEETYHGKIHIQS